MIDGWYVSDMLSASFHVDASVRHGTNPLTIAVTPTILDNDDNKADVCLSGGFMNPFPLHSEAARSAGFVTGYRDMQRRIRGCRVLNLSTSKDGVDTIETVTKLLEFILRGSYAKHWKEGGRSGGESAISFDYTVDGAAGIIPTSPDAIVLWWVAIILPIVLLIVTLGSNKVRLVFLGMCCFAVVGQLALTSFFLWRVMRIPKTNFATLDTTGVPIS